MFIEDYGLSFKVIGTSPRSSKTKRTVHADVLAIIREYSTKNEVFVHILWHGKRSAGLFNMVIAEHIVRFEISRRTWEEFPKKLCDSLLDHFDDELVYVEKGDKYNLRKVICS